MAHFAFILAIALPFLVAAAHIIGTRQLPISSSSSLRGQPPTSSYSLGQPPTSSSSRRQPPGTSAVSSSSFEVRHQPADTGDFFDDDRHQLRQPKLKPEPAVLEDLKKRGSKTKDMVERLEHLGKVLRLFGYNKMASAATLLADSKILALWSAPITIFAVPDAALEEACPSCAPRLLVLKQIALGSYPFSKLASRPSFKLTTPAFTFCMSTMTTIVLSSDGGLTKVVSINNVDITRPELYNDGQFVIHGMKSYIHLPPQGSCTDGESLSVGDVMKMLHDTFAKHVF